MCYTSIVWYGVILGKCNDIRTKFMIRRVYLILSEVDLVFLIDLIWMNISKSKSYVERIIH